MPSPIRATLPLTEEELETLKQSLGRDVEASLRVLQAIKTLPGAESAEKDIRRHMGRVDALYGRVCAHLRPN